MEQGTAQQSAGEQEGAIRLLLVDDDPQIVEALTLFFENEGWDIRAAATGEEALQKMEQQRDLDLVLLDVHLPGLDGFEVLQRSQEIGVVAPVIMISTSAGDAQRLRALGLGAQDYLTKPFQPEALQERIESAVGKAGQRALSDSSRYQIGEATIDLKAARLYRNGEEHALSEVQLDLLRVLLASQGQAVSRKRLLQEGLGLDKEGVAFTLTLRVLYDMLEKHIGGIRQLLEPDPHHPVHIEKVFGQGYRLRA